MLYAIHKISTEVLNICISFTAFLAPYFSRFSQVHVTKRTVWQNYREVSETFAVF